MNNIYKYSYFLFSIIVFIIFLIPNTSSAQLKIDEFTYPKRHTLFPPSYTYGTIIASNYKKSNLAKERVTAEADTSTQKNKVEYIRTSRAGNRHYMKLDLVNTSDRITISVFNLLGKQVLDVYNDKPKPKDIEYTIDSSQLPSGVYICTIVGKDFRLTEKFVVSR